MRLILTIGAPGSGKTTFARSLVSKLLNKGRNAAIFSKDDLRNMLTGSTDKQKYWNTLAKTVPSIEASIRNMVFGCISLGVRSGVDTVIIPDCHPTLKSITYTLEKLRDCGLKIDSVKIYTFTNISLKELYEINQLRPKDDQVDEGIIQQLHGLCSSSIPDVRKYARRNRKKLEPNSVDIRIHMCTKNPILDNTDKEE